ncbi:MAG: hypothetical protein ACFFBD_12855 [Candidatus Hodarchaeota archaeon]
MSHEYPCTYFDPLEKSENTQKTLEIAHEYAKKHSIKDIIVASTHGSTGLMAAKLFSEFNCVVVIHQYGFNQPGGQQMPPETIQEIKNLGAKVLSTTHALGGIDRAAKSKFNSLQFAEIVAAVLKIFGQGTKVAAEIVLMAADSGLIGVPQDVLSIGGTGRGADTCWVIGTAHTQNFFDLKMKKCLCKPYK